MIGQSALASQKRIDSGEQTVVGVNAYQIEENAADYPSLAYPERTSMDAQVAKLKQFKANRSASAAQNALDRLARTANSKDGNIFEQVVASADACATHGEICATLRRELGFGQPLTII
jgi:methylmalonyl-CoA mutase N-terminal domain/subunit